MAALGGLLGVGFRRRDARPCARSARSILLRRSGRSASPRPRRAGERSALRVVERARHPDGGGARVLRALHDHVHGPDRDRVRRRRRRDGRAAASALGASRAAPTRGARVALGRVEPSRFSARPRARPPRRSSGDRLRARSRPLHARPFAPAPEWRRAGGRRPLRLLGRAARAATAVALSPGSALSPLGDGGRRAAGTPTWTSPGRAAPRSGGPTSSPPPKQRSAPSSCTQTSSRKTPLLARPLPPRPRPSPLPPLAARRGPDGRSRRLPRQRTIDRAAEGSREGCLLPSPRRASDPGGPDRARLRGGRVQPRARAAGLPDARPLASALLARAGSYARQFH